MIYSKPSPNLYWDQLTFDSNNITLHYLHKICISKFLNNNCITMIFYKSKEKRFLFSKRKLSWLGLLFLKIHFSEKSFEYSFVLFHILNTIFNESNFTIHFLHTCSVLDDSLRPTHSCKVIKFWKYITKTNIISF